MTKGISSNPNCPTTFQQSDYLFPSDNDGSRQMVYRSPLRLCVHCLGREENKYDIIMNINNNNNNAQNIGVDKRRVDEQKQKKIVNKPKMLDFARRLVLNSR